MADPFWPAQRTRAARSNFRRAVANLRGAIGDRTANRPHLHVTRETVQFNLASDATVDVVRFLSLVETPETQLGWVQNLEQAIALYRGPFLEGFALDDCPEFEQWMTTTRSALEQLAAGALYRLAEHYYIQAEGERALVLYERCLELDPYHEAAQRGLMRLLAANHQRAAALARFAAFRRRLLDELSAEPEAQTVGLCEAIRQGRFAADDTPVTPTGMAAADVTLQAQGLGADHPLVGREEQLALLHTCARQAERGHSSTVFVIGEAGSGKTSLLHVFARQLGRSHRGWLVAHGACTALLGIGDPYQPFADVVRMLADDDVEMRTPNGSPSADATATDVLRTEAPDWTRLTLINKKTSANIPQADQPAISSTAQSSNLAAHNDSDTQPVPVPQAALFDQLTRFLTRLAQRQTVLLALDNLHWADTGAIALLFHLAQRLTHSRVLLVGAYRPGALALAQAEHNHPLGTVVQELRQQPGATLIDLDQADGRRFVDALLDREPNRFDEQFRENLVQHTEGHALFTVELLHALREIGRLSQDRDGRWQLNGEVNWDVLPPHVEALIHERVDGLPPADRALLNVASVEGDEFSAEIAAAVTGIDAWSVVERLSGDLSARHRMVYATRVRHLAGATVACYRFRHHLFQAYLYGALDAVQRDRLHRNVALELERLYTLHGESSGVTPQQLVWHFQRAGQVAEAMKYLSPWTTLVPAERER